MAYIVKSAVRGLLKGMRASEDFFKEIDALIARRCKRAIERAKANGRKTLRGHDV
jgi:histone H3/H4